VEIREAITPNQVQTETNEFLRQRLVITNLFKKNQLNLVYSHHDRILLGGAILDSGEISLETPQELSSDYFFQRREAGIACLSGSVTIQADGKNFQLDAEDILYVGRGTKNVLIKGTGSIYLSSSMCHADFTTTLAKKSESETLVIGEASRASQRTLRKYIHEGGVASASMAMGITTLHEGSVWNTLPCHVHERRTEAYLYFDLDPNEKVIHLFGKPDQTRNFVMGNMDVVISPAWSIHTGAGTSQYKFVWSTAGENITYTDFTPVPTKTLG
jgi:4-deoxy-L-threo-5-hexosulose-uronate ketol-isomerase